MRRFEKPKGQYLTPVASFAVERKLLTETVDITAVVVKKCQLLTEDIASPTA
jgi:hypothetical protein